MSPASARNRRTLKDVELLQPDDDDALADVANELDQVDDDDRVHVEGWARIGMRAAQLGHRDVAIVKRGARFYYRCSCMAGVVAPGGHGVPGLSRLSWVNEVQALLMVRRHLLDSVTQSERHDRALGVSHRRKV
jgi:hypothetical protein